MNLSTFKAFKNMSSKGMIEIKGDELRAVKAVLLDMMAVIDDVCRKNNIAYFLSGGSMLGAVRHKGFIPWDDDIDIFMTRKDFERFKVIFPVELGSGYYLTSPEFTHDYGVTTVKIRKKGTVMKGRADSRFSDECGVWIDVFVLENTYNSGILRRLHCLLSMSAGFALSCRMFYSRRELYLYLLGDRPELSRVCKTKIAVGFLLSFLSLDTWTRLTAKVYSWCRNDSSKYVVCPSGRGHFSGEIYPRDPFTRTIEWDFEGRKYFISEWYDSYLKQLYGDYMQIPPESERETHVVLEFDLGDAYKKEE